MDKFLAPIFFILVYIAGITSLLATIEPISFSIQNKFGLSRKRAVTILCIIGAILSMMFATTYGEILINTVDAFINQVAIILGIIFECIVFTQIFKVEDLINSLNSHSKLIKIDSKWKIFVKYILPIFLSIIWIGGIYDLITIQFTDSIIVMILTAIVLIIFTIIFTRLPSKNPEWNKAKERV